MSRLRSPVQSGGPDAVHLCLTVGNVPHLWGCAWASYGEARLPVPASGGSLSPRNRIVRARRILVAGAGGAGGRLTGEDGPTRSR